MSDSSALSGVNVAEACERLRLVVACAIDAERLAGQLRDQLDALGAHDEATYAPCLAMELVAERIERLADGIVEALDEVETPCEELTARLYRGAEWIGTTALADELQRMASGAETAPQCQAAENAHAARSVQ